MNRLIQQLFAIHDAMDKAGYAHAFGGAIALAYCTKEPRGTRDLDLNVFADASRAEEVIRQLPDGVVFDAGDIAKAERDGQVRLWWDETPVDLFLSNLEFHREVGERIAKVPLGGREIPVLDCSSLAVFKAYFDRGKDWVDIELMAEKDPSVIELAAATVGRLTGKNDPRRGRLIRIAARGSLREGGR
jgi:hypothetical protein